MKIHTYSTLSLLLFFCFGSFVHAQPTTYSNTASYSVGDLVVSGSATYIAKQSSTGQTPPNTTYWEDLSVAATALSIPVEAVPTLDTQTILNSLPGFTPDSNATSFALSNLSTRGYVGTGDSQMIAGFIVSGSGNAVVTIRALGPTLTDLGVAGALADPVLTVKDSSGNTIVQNDSYADAASATDVASSGKANIKALEPAVQIKVSPGNYTAIVSGANGTTGNALVEVYNENGSDSTVSLSNLSTRGYVGTGDSQMIAGFIVSNATTVTIRALGPTLTGLGVSGALSNPVLTIKDSSGNTVVENDNFADAASATAVASSGKSNIDAAEPAVQIKVTPGNYTAIVSGSGGTTGNALVEVYDEDN